MQLVHVYLNFPGTTEEALLTAVAYLFPNLSPAELSAALQVATTEAERKVLRPH